MEGVGNVERKGKDGGVEEGKGKVGKENWKAHSTTLLSKQIIHITVLFFINNSI